MSDLISREDLRIEITKQIAHFKDKANTTSINQDKLAYSLTATGLELARNLIDNAPTVEAYAKDDMTREYLKGYNACKDMNERPHCGAEMGV